MSFLAYLKYYKKYVYINLAVVISFLLINFLIYLYYCDDINNCAVYVSTVALLMFYYLLCIYLEYNAFKKRVQEQIMRDAFDKFEEFVINNENITTIYMGKMLYKMNFQHYVLLFHITNFVVDYTVDDYSFTTIPVEDRLETINDLYN
jgi:hypothetical protein